jgi:DNA primase
VHRRFEPRFLRGLRNDIPIEALIGDLDIPSKRRDGYFRFLCPLCSDFHTATNPETNLARCFRCRRNFNPIELLMVVEQKDFVDSVHALSERLEERVRQCRDGIAE